MALAARPGSAAELLTLSEAARLAGVDRETVRAWCDRGDLALISGQGRQVRLRRRDLERLLEAGLHDQPAPREPRRALARPASADEPLRPHAGDRRARAGEATGSEAGEATRNGKAVGQPRKHGRRPGRNQPRLVKASGADALRRLASELSGSRTLQPVFEEVLENSIALFHADRAGLWLWHPTAEHPLELVAGRLHPPLIKEVVERATRDSRLAGFEALRREVVIVYQDVTDPKITPQMREVYAKSGIGSICFVPAVFRGAPLALLVLYHDIPYDWTPEETALARSFGDTIATAIGNARLMASVEDLAARLRAIQDLSARLSGIQDVRAIGETIVAEAGALIEYDTFRVYRIDHDSGWCEPIAFDGVFMGRADPDPESLRVRIGEGLTGWVAEHGEALILGNAHEDPRSIIVGKATGPESMLIVPMVHEGHVRGVVAASRLGKDRFGPDDETTLSIFAGTAAQALVNAERLEQLRRQQVELEHQLVSQRRLMAVNERLLSTLDPTGVLEMIADSLKSVVTYDSLTIYRIDRERNVRRPLIARDRFADLILDYEAPLGTGLTGWAVEHREAVLANDAHLDPRSIQIPGTPFEPESMVIVPLMAEGEVLGTLNIGRMGGPEAHYTQNEFELTKLFAAQAAIALRNAEAHDEVKVQAERDALTGLRNHGAFQRELQGFLSGQPNRSVAVLMMDLDRFKGYNDRNGHPAGDELLVAVSRAIEGCIRQGDRAYRYGGDEFGVILPDCGRQAAEEVARRIQQAVDAIPDDTGPHVSVSIGIACHPEDGTDKETLVETADQALFLAKGAPFRSARDQFVAAFDEMTLGLIDGSDTDTLLDSILTRAARLLGVPNGYVYLGEPGDTHLTIRAGIGDTAGDVGFRMPVTQGVSGRVFTTGRPLLVENYDEFEGRHPRFVGRAGSVVGVPLTVGGRTVGVIGLSTGPSERVFRQAEVEALLKFAQLASIALENARLHEAALSPRDPVTTLPTRESLIQRVVEALEPAPAGAGSAGSETAPVTVILLDVDRFEIVNESLGHATGDRVLREVGRRISQVIGPFDMVGRFSGDTFGILLPDCDADQATAFAERVQMELKRPFDLDGRTWFISASMGIAVGSPGLVGAGDILQEAEIALVGAKRDPAHRVRMYDPLSSRHALERLDVEAELWTALERDELTVHYQPIFDLRASRIVGFEALARWQHPSRGLVLPVDFIALAEESELIVAIGRVILEKACRQAQLWRQRWPELNLAMSVNLSPRQFLDPNLLNGIGQVLRTTGLEPCALELEITESSVMDRSETSLSVLQQLRALGVRVVLDDFGTGYSSLAYLRQLPLDTIKIDRSFVTDLDVRDPNIGIIRAVVSLAHGLGITVVAEGIETEEQARRLRELGCDMGQGFAWAEPAGPIRTARFVAQRLGEARSGIGGARSGAGPDRCGPDARRAAVGQRRPPNSRSRNRNRLTKSR
ncbi:MAG TPA: EAL domain-containing protein [Candidatus Binatia bacterium]|nr:EAL domain-containing protein [Candidatus Binatia bacterium]